MKILKFYSIITSIAILYLTWKALDYRASANLFLNKYHFYLDNFGQRNYYLMDNEPLQSDTILANRVVFIGTQAVKNWDLDQSFSDYETINRGINQQPAPAMLLRFSSDVLSLAPKAVVIEVSSYNFRPDNSVSELIEATQTMALLSRSKGVIPVLTTVIPPCKDLSFDPDCLECPNYHIWDSLSSYNQALSRFAAEEGFPLSDWNHLLSDSDGYLSDSLAVNTVEPNKNGYEILSYDLNSIFRKL